MARLSADSPVFQDARLQRDVRFLVLVFAAAFTAPSLLGVAAITIAEFF